MLDKRSIDFSDFGKDPVFRSDAHLDHFEFCRTQISAQHGPDPQPRPHPRSRYSFLYSVFDSRIYNHPMWLASTVIGAYCYWRLMWLAPVDRSPYAGHESRRHQDNCYWENPPSVLHPGEYQVGGTSTYHRIGPCLTQSFVTVSVSILVCMDPYWDGFPDLRSSSELTIIKFGYFF